MQGLKALLFAAALSVLLAMSAQAAYPEKTIRIVITTTAGGQADVVARVLAVKLSEKFGSPVIVEAKPGANGIIATDLVAKSAPDGYTLLLATGSHAINPAVYAKLPFNPKRDFAAVAQVLPPGPLVLVAHPSLGVKNIEELIALARSKPSSVAYASAGVGNTTHLGGEMFQQLTGIQLTHVPYKGMSQAVTDVVSGQVPLMFNPWQSSENFVKEGKLKVLAQTGIVRMSTIPNVPTMAEAGVKGFDLTGWYVLLAPTGTPTDVVNKLNAAVFEAMNSADTKAKLASLGSTTAQAVTPAEVGAFIASETARMERVAKAAGIALETPN